jgi:hypothetical protein
MNQFQEFFKNRIPVGKDDYKPYQEEWEGECTLQEFIVWLTFQLSSFENNLTRLNVQDKSKEEWMNLFLLWSEYSK